MGTTVEQLMLAIGGDPGGADKALRSVTSEAVQASNTIASASVASAGRAAAAFAGATAALGGLVMLLGGAAVSAASDFQYGMANVYTMIDDSKSFELLEKQVRALSPALGDTDSLTGGLYDIISASVDAADAAGVLEIALKTAKAGMTDGRTAADALTSVMNSFGLKGAPGATKAANLLFEAVRLGKTDFAGLASSIGRAAPIAATYGVRMEEVAAAVGMITRMGGGSAQAMTEVSALVSKIAAPGEQSRKAFNSMGIAFGKSALEAKGLTGVLADIYTQTKGDPLKVKLLLEDKEAVQSFFKLMKDDMKTYIGDLQTVGQATAEGSTTMMTAYDKVANTFTDQMKTMWTGIKQVFREAGTPLLEDATTIVKGINARLLTIRDAAAPAMTELWANIKGTFEKIKTGWAEVVALGEGAMVDPAAVAMHLGFSEETVNAVGATIDEVQRRVDRFMTAWSAGASTGALLHVLGLDPGTSAEISGALQASEDFAKTAFTNIEGAAASAADAVKAGWFDAMAILGMENLPLTEQIHVLWDTVTGMTADIAAEMPFAFDALSSTVIGVFDAMTRGFETLYKWFTKDIPDGLSTMYKDIQKQLAELSDAMSKTAATIFNGFSSITTKLFDTINGAMNALLAIPKQVSGVFTTVKSYLGFDSTPDAPQPDTQGMAGASAGVSNVGAAATLAPAGVGAAAAPTMGGQAQQPSTSGFMGIPSAAGAAAGEKPAGFWDSVANSIGLGGLSSGTIVPGVGVGDKVPAMLEPGEAVIPRADVPGVMSALGAQGFADGGVAGGDRFTPKGATVGGPGAWDAKGPADGGGGARGGGATSSGSKRFESIDDITKAAEERIAEGMRKGSKSGLIKGADEGMGTKDKPKTAAERIYKQGIDAASSSLIDGLMSGDVGGAIKGFAKGLGSAALNALKQAMMEGLSTKVLKFLGMGFASGTAYAPGGLAWVGEHGKELVNLPPGSQVYPHSTSMAMAAAGDGGSGGGGPTFYIENLNIGAGFGATPEQAAREFLTAAATIWRKGNHRDSASAIRDIAARRK